MNLTTHHGREPAKESCGLSPELRVLVDRVFGWLREDLRVEPPPSTSTATVTVDRAVGQAIASAEIGSSPTAPQREAVWRARLIPVLAALGGEKPSPEPHARAEVEAEPGSSSAARTIRFEAFQAALRTLVVIASSVERDIHVESGTAILRVLDELCAPIAEKANALGQRSAENAAARLTGRPKERLPSPTEQHLDEDTHEQQSNVAPTHRRRSQSNLSLQRMAGLMQRV